MKKLLCALIAVLCLWVAAFGAAGAETGTSVYALPDQAELDGKVEAIVEYLALEGKSDYEIIFRVYDYICQTVEYDDEVYDRGEEYWDGVSLGYGQTAYEALCLEKAVCAGIANAVKLLLDEMGIPCKVAVGQQNIAHSWNFVKLNGEWYFLDATNDLGRSNYSLFLKGWDDVSGYTFVEDENDFTLDELALAESSYAGSFEARQDSWGGYTFNVGLGDIVIYSYAGTEKNLVIPSEINGRPVKALAQYFLQYNDSVETLVLSEGIEHIARDFIGQCEKLTSVSLPSTAQFNYDENVIGVGGFVDNCPAMQTITVAEGNPYLCVQDNILYNKDMTKLLYRPAKSPAAAVRVPESVQLVADEAFTDNVYLEEVVLPDSVQMIGYWSFMHCSSLKKINIPEKCTLIGQYAFRNTDIQEIHIPAATEDIAGDALPDTLRIITVDAVNPVYYAADNVLFRRDGTLFRYAAGKTEGTYVVPDGVKVIGGYAFENAENLKSVVLPDSVVSIGEDAFYGCSGLLEMTLPDSVADIGNGAFWDCRHLAKLVIPASVQKIEGTSMLANVTGTVIFGAKGTEAERWASENQFTFIDMNAPWNLSGVCGDGVSWSLSEDGVLKVSGKGKMHDYEWQQSPWNAYANMVRSAIVSEGVISVGAYAFCENKNLTQLSLPDSLTTIEDSAFWRCESLNTVSVPENVTNIAPYAFSSCGLEQILIPGGDTHLDIQVFEYCSDFVICCRAGSYAEQYAGWESIGCNKYNASLRVPDSAAAIESQAFGNVGAVLVYIPDCVTKIADDAFDEGTVVVGPSGSYAEEWAEERGFCFFAE